MKIRKAILTGGGRATRLHPITSTINKHLLPLANKPMIFHAIEKAVAAGVTEIFINTNPGETELQKYIGDGGHWGISIKFFEQTGGPQGIAHVVNEARDFIGKDPFMFYLSDNILLGDLHGLFDTFHKGKYDCMLALSEVNDPQRFGIATFDDNGTILDVIEKPKNPPNNLAVTGIYLYGPRVFFDAFNRIEKSHRGEYEISDIHSLFLKEGKRVGHKEITGWWKDTGKAEDLLLANQLLLDQIEPRSEHVGVMIDTDVHIEGNVHIGAGSQIKKGTIVKGPVIIAENCIIDGATIGPHVTIGAGTVIKDAKIKQSILLDNSTIDCDMHITDSMLGRGITLKKRDHQYQEGKRMIIGDKTILEV